MCYGWSVAVLVASVVVGVYLSSQTACADMTPRTCELILDMGLCALMPALSRSVCPKACGWCLHAANPIPSPSSLWSSFGGLSLGSKKAARHKWKPIPRVPANITAEEFQVYRLKKTPVVIEGWVHSEAPSMAKWDLDEVVRRCGDRRVTFGERRAHFLRELDEMLGQGLPRRLVDFYTTRYLNLSLLTAINASAEASSVRALVERMRADRSGERTIKHGFRTMFDYLAAPTPLNDYPLEVLCPEFREEAVIPKLLLGRDAIQPHPPRTACFDRHMSDMRLHPVAYLEAHGARAYPTHRHGDAAATKLSGRPTTDLLGVQSFHVLVEGGKKVVFWPPSEQDKLYPLLRDLSTETGDEVFMAEGVHRRFDLYPAMAHTEGWEGSFEAGDMLYVPSGGIHVFESVGVSLGVRYAANVRTEGESAAVQQARTARLDGLEYYSPDQDELEKDAWPSWDAEGPVTVAELKSKVCPKTAPPLPEVIPESDIRHWFTTGGPTSRKEHDQLTGSG